MGLEIHTINKQPILCIFKYFQVACNVKELQSDQRTHQKRRSYVSLRSPDKYYWSCERESSDWLPLMMDKMLVTALSLKLMVGPSVSVKYTTVKLVWSGDMWTARVAFVALLPGKGCYQTMRTSQKEILQPIWQHSVCCRILVPCEYKICKKKNTGVCFKKRYINEFCVLKSCKTKKNKPSLWGSC